MIIGDKIEWDGKIWTVEYIEDRNTYEPLPGVTLLGDVVILNNGESKIQVYDFDLLTP